MTSLKPVDLLDFFTSNDNEQQLQQHNYLKLLQDAQLSHFQIINKLETFFTNNSNVATPQKTFSRSLIIKEDFKKRINENYIFYAVILRYFKVLHHIAETSFKQNQQADQSQQVLPIQVRLVTAESGQSSSNGDNLGIIASPQEIEQLYFSNIDANVDATTATTKAMLNYPEYLFALLRLAEELVDYSTRLIILLSSSSNQNQSSVSSTHEQQSVQQQHQVEKDQYSIVMINEKLISYIQQGFELLELKNDPLRRKFDGLKYSTKKIQSMIYDLSVRGLIVRGVQFDEGL